MKNLFDVVIIGAGPAGSATAITLAKKGYEVALLDKRLFPRDKLCGDFVNPINWPAFENLGGTARLLAQPHADVSGFRITTVSGAEEETSFEFASHEQTTGLGLRRALLEQVLVDRAAALGVEIRLGRR